MLFGVIVLLFLHLSAGAEITSIHVYKEDLYTELGSRLTIPCMFNVDEPIRSDDKIQLEWGMTPEGGGAYTTIVRSIDPTLFSVSLANPGFEVITSNLRRRICSMTIKAASHDDSGTYELHLMINGIEYQPIPKIHIHVKKATEPPETETNQSPVDKKDVNSLVEAKTEDRPDPETQWEMFKSFSKLKKHHWRQNWQYIVAAVAIIAFLLLVGCIGGCFCGATIVWMKMKKKDPFQAMEEGG